MIPMKTARACGKSGCCVAESVANSNLQSPIRRSGLSQTSSQSCTHADRLAHHDLDKRASVILEIKGLVGASVEAEYGRFLFQCKEVLKRWYPKLERLEEEWKLSVVEKLKSSVKGARPKVVFKNSQDKSVFYIRNYIAFSRKGVAEFGQVLGATKALAPLASDS